MRLSCYERDPHRFNPEFIGIASRYFQQKKMRIKIHQAKKQLTNDLLYTQKQDRSLQMHLMSKTQELKRLKQVKQRKEEQSREKEAMNVERKRRLMELRNRNNQSRNSSKQKLQQVKINLMGRNKQTMNKMRMDLSRLSQKFRKLERQDAEERTSKCQSIREDQAEAKRKISKFHRDKNQQSLEDYLNRIKEERRLKRQNTRRIREYERCLEDMTKTLDVKHKYLKEMEEQVSKFIGTADIKQSRRVKIERRQTEGSGGSNKLIKFQLFDNFGQNPQHMT